MGDQLNWVRRLRQQRGLYSVGQRHPVCGVDNSDLHSHV